MFEDWGGDFEGLTSGKSKWIDYELIEDEYISGIWGQLHGYFGYICKLGLITNKDKTNIFK